IQDVLERRHLGRTDAKHLGPAGRWRRGELRAQVEELALEVAQDAVQLATGRRAIDLRRVEGAGDADRGIELVHGAVRLDARRVLVRSLAADEVGLAVVTATGVDARDPDGHGPFLASAPRVVHRALPARAMPAHANMLSGRRACRLISARS